MGEVEKLKTSIEVAIQVAQEEKRGILDQITAKYNCKTSDEKAWDLLNAVRNLAFQLVKQTVRQR